jgi:4-diphosphocytidyl-2-C-methyl-D-erythritol kinase
LKKVFIAPAKINLCLHVLGRREDGYHELAMAMQRVDLCDTVEIELSDRSGVRVACPGIELPPGGENIAAQAAQLILDEAGSAVGVDIHITKRIPVAAGLGGGSSDAATVLVGLSEMLGLRPGIGRFQSLGSRLGADVPFFIFKQPAWATGTGTQLERLPALPKVAYLLINPRVAVSTADVYRSLQLTKQGELANLPKFSVMTRDDLCAALHNDLETVVLDRFPQVAAVKERLLEQGALGALMSGSGSTVFGVYPDYSAACVAAEQLAKENDWLIYPVRPL